MGCFVIDLTSPMELIFYALSLAQFFRAVQLAGRIRQEWPALRQAPLTPQKAHLAEESAFLLAVPPSVLVHELFHAVPIWLFDGRIARCGYGFYWGYVQPDRFFSPTQEWIISLGGTLGSLLFTAVLFGLLYANQNQTLRYFGFQTLKKLLYYSLIYYPIFTAFTFIGDWRIIYDFSTTPTLSGATAVLHLLILLLFWRADRRGWFEMVSHPTQAEADSFAHLMTQWQHNPQDASLALQLADRMRLGGASQKASRLLEQAIRQHPNTAGLYLQLALIQHGGKGRVPGTAVRNLEKAVQLGLSDPRQLASAHHLLGQHYLDGGQGQTALKHLEQASQAAEAWTESPINPLFIANLHYLRSLAYLRLAQPELARPAVQQALQIAQKADNKKAIAYYQSKLEMVESWNGRS